MSLFAATLIGLLKGGVELSAQSGYEVKGVVNDAMGPVIGATVLEMGTTNGTSTGIDGDFILKVSSKDAMFLDDVVVIGYGSQKKKEVTGSVGISGLEGIDSAKSLTVLLNGSKKSVKVDIPQGNYIVLAQNGKADADGLGAYTGAYISALPTSATILAE